MNFNTIIPSLVEQLIDKYNNLQNQHIEDETLNGQVQRAEVIFDRLIMSVKIDRVFEKELLQFGFDKDVSKCLVVPSDHSSKSRCCERFKIKNCGIDEYDLFVKSLLDRGIKTYICGKNLSAAYDGPEPRSFIAQGDGETDVWIDGRYVHVKYKKGDVLVPIIKNLNIKRVNTNCAPLVALWNKYSTAQINALCRSNIAWSPISSMYPKYQESRTS